MATAQTSDKPHLGFVYTKDIPSTEQVLTKQLTIDSVSQTTGITVTKDPDEEWIVVPETVDHGTPFDVQFVPTAAAQNDHYRFLDRTITLTFSKATYEDLEVEVRVKSQPGGPPAKR